MRRVGFLTLVAATLALWARSDANAQDYILRPGPRGFDPDLNQYGSTESANAPRPAGDRFNPSRTNVKIEILMTGDGAALDAQRWNKIFADLGFAARFRRAILDDKPEISETTRGPLRFVTVVGSLDRRGNLQFPDRTFSPADVAELKEWLDELKSYGAQGSPAGQPLWGLSRTQFEAVYSALSQPAEGEVGALPLPEAISRLKLPKQYGIRFSVAAKEKLDAPGQPATVSRSIPGVSAGTALAFILNDFGLAFRPERMPGGSIDLVVVPRPESTKLPKDGGAEQVIWPVGWDIADTPSPERGDRPVRDKDAMPPKRVQIAPGLFSMRDGIEFADVTLAEAFAQVESEAGVIVMFDRPALDAAKIDPQQLRVTTPAQRTSWNLVLRSLTFRHRLRHEIRHDEVGRPIIWVTTMRR